MIIISIEVVAGVIEEARVASSITPPTSILLKYFTQIQQQQTHSTQSTARVRIMLIIILSCHTQISVTSDGTCYK